MNFAELPTLHDPTRIALIGSAGTTSYGELCERSERLRGTLGTASIRPGDRVAIIAANNELFVTSLLATLGLGAVAVPLNPTAPAPQLERELREAEVSAVLAGPAGAARLRDVDAEFLAGLRLLASPGTGYEQLLEADPVPVLSMEADDPAVVLFTSGTAGPSRGAVLSHGNLLVNHEQMLAADPEAVVADDVALAVLPLFHVFGLNVVLGLAMRAGAALALEERFDPARTLAVCDEHGVTVVAAAPPLWAAWADAGTPSAPLVRLRRARSGAAALPPAVASALDTHHGLSVAEGYGLTETAPAVTIPPANEVRQGSVGRPLPGVEVRLVDDEGHDALVGDPGEVWVRGPNVFAGYLDGGPNSIDAHGWLHTGDVAVVDDDGWLYLVDRQKDLIIVSGFNVYPAEVEDVLTAHPVVVAAAVVGEPDPSAGERVVAHVVVSDRARFEEQEMLDHVAAHLPRFKCPSRIDVHDELPVSATGKVPRRLLRD